MKDFRTLKVWQLGHELTLEVYKITVNFTKEEIYGLTSQMRRSSASIPTNIAEGCGRISDAELIKYFYIAMGSASELEYQFILSKDLGYLNHEEYDVLNFKLISLKKMLNTFIQKVKARNTPKT